jgi:hypothetical protein
MRWRARGIHAKTRANSQTQNEAKLEKRIGTDKRLKDEADFGFKV